MKIIPIPTQNLNSTHVRYVEVVGTQTPFSCRFAFEIDLANGRKVYMRTGDGFDSDVVLVQSDKFLHLWKNYRDEYWRYKRMVHERDRPRGIAEWFKTKFGYSTYDSEFNQYWEAQSDLSNPRCSYPHELSYKDEDGWRSFRKFPAAEHGFTWGVANPVPLALVGCNQEESGVVTVGFTNGVTRTIWLLANGAKEFPLRCHSGGVGPSLLHRLAGADGTNDICKVD